MASCESGHGSREEVTIIKEIYDDVNAHEMFENELEKALEAKCPTIIIEPSRLGEETAKWIAIGNCLQKTAAVSGLASIVTGSIWPDRLYIYCPMGTISVLCIGLYGISWQTDRCCKYQVERNPEKLAQLRLHTLDSSSAIVIVKKDYTRRKLLHTTISLLALAMCAWRVYKSYS